ncbi:MAG: hypothetical protein K6F57_01910 [Candidatus Saccharibacteria bacterium]|nr:hypothetical protein [Candidatus Saccharibacteria bacterium]
MSEFSEYEENMIGFLMGHGTSQEDAEHEVVKWRIDVFGDGDHVATKEDVDSLGLKPIIELRTKPKLNPYSRIDAFRLSIGDEAWKALGADRVSRDLLIRAIEFDYYAWRKQYESSQPKEVLENLMLEQLRQEGLSDKEIFFVDYYMNWYCLSFDEAKAHVLEQRHE